MIAFSLKVSEIVAPLLQEELEKMKEVLFISVDRPHFLLKSRHVVLKVCCQSEERFQKSVQRAYQKVEKNLGVLEHEMNGELRKIFT